MSNGVIATGEGIRVFHLLALKGALRLESLGMTRRGRSALACAKSEFGLRSNDRQMYIRLIEARLRVMKETLKPTDIQSF
jgi:hypothetical protein